MKLLFLIPVIGMLSGCTIVIDRGDHDQRIRPLGYWNIDNLNPAVKVATAPFALATSAFKCLSPPEWLDEKYICEFDITSWGLHGNPTYTGVLR